MNKDVEVALSAWERKLCNKLERVEIRGKRGRKVPVLLTADMIHVLDLLISARRKVGVLDSNQFLFARPRCNTPFRAADCLKRFALASGATHPENVTSTKLRKHVATMSQLICLKDNELDILAGFLGHDIQIHRDYYRLPENTLQMAKVAKLLMLLEKGGIQNAAGKTLDDINLDLDEPCSDDESADEDEETPNEQLSLEASQENTDVGSHLVESGRKKLSPNEAAAIDKFFKRHVNTQRVPRKHEIECFKSSNPVVQHIDWKKIKFRVYNAIQRNRKR